MISILSGYYQFDFLFFSTILFFIGLFGILLMRKNIILILICIEILFLAVNLNFIIFSVFLNDIFGQVFAIYVIAVAGAEAAIGLALLIIFYRLRKIIALDFISALKG